MDKLQNFSFKNNNIKIAKINNSIWFLAKDVANILGQSNPHRTVLHHVYNHNTRILKWRDMNSLFKANLWGKNDYSNKLFVNETGLYSMTLHSHLPEATQFYDWINDKALPSINHNDTYVISKAAEKWLNNPDMMIAILIKYKNTQTRLKESKFQKQNIKAKADFYKRSRSSRGAILVGDMAKLLKKSGINTGQNRLFKWLRNNHYLSSRHGLDWNTPTQRSLDMDIITFKERSKNFLDGSKFIFKTPLITGKGQQYFYEKLIKKVNNK